MGERQEGRHAGGRKGHRVESVAARGGDLAEYDLRRRFAVSLHHLSHRRELRFVPPLTGGVEGAAGGESVGRAGIERLNRPNGLFASVAFGGGGRRAELESLRAKMLGRELAVIGDRLACGAFIKDLRLVRIAPGFGGAGAPIGGAGDRERRLGRLGGALETLCGGASVAEET